MAGLPSKYMKNLKKYGGMKGAWAAFRREEGGGSSSGGGSSKKKKGGGVTFFNRPGKGKGSEYASATLGILVDAMFAILGAGITAGIVHFTPGLKNLPAWARASIQGGVGTLSFFLPFNFARMMGLGAVIVGGTTLVNTFTGFSVLAGPGDVLNREAMDELTKGILNGPIQIAGMNGPAYVMQTMNGPVYVSAGGMSGGGSIPMSQALVNDPHSWVDGESWRTGNGW